MPATIEKLSFLFEFHFCIFLQPVVHLPWTAVCSASIFGDYTILMTQILVVLLVASALTIIALFEFRLKAVTTDEQKVGLTVLIVLKFSIYLFGFTTIVINLMARHDFMNQFEYKTRIREKFNGMPDFMFCQLCLFIPFESKMILINILSAIFFLLLVAFYCAISIYLTISALKSVRIRVSTKTATLQRNFVQSLFVQQLVHVLMLCIPLIGFFGALFIGLSEQMMWMSYVLIAILSQHGSISTIVMLITNQQLMQTIRNTYVRKISTIQIESP